jgi:hypothetical protein
LEDKPCLIHTTERMGKIENIIKAFGGVLDLDLSPEYEGIIKQMRINMIQECKTQIGQLHYIKQTDNCWEFYLLEPRAKYIAYFLNTEQPEYLVELLDGMEWTVQGEDERDKIIAFFGDIEW